MTDREKAIVSAYTGILMLDGDKLDIYYDYLAEIFGRRVLTHEIPMLTNKIKELSYNDFISICRAENLNTNTDSGIWKKVNLRAAEKNIPDFDKYIVFRTKTAFGSMFSTGKTYFNEKKNCYEIENISAFGQYTTIKSGLIWCYAEDIEADAQSKQKG